jgi:hypothetical protein
MKTSSLKLKIILVIIGLAIFGYAEVWGADWKLYNYGVTGDTFHYYDAESVTRPSENIVRVWTKTIYSEKDINDFVTKYGQWAKNIGDTRALKEIDCKEKKLRLLSLNVYSKWGDMLMMADESALKEFGEWNFIAPETILESLYKVLCK